MRAEKSAAGGINCRSIAGVRQIEDDHFIGFFTMARCLLLGLRAALNYAHRSSAMPFAIGAVSVALDAIQSLTSPQPASQPFGFGPGLPDASDSPAVPAAVSPTIAGFSNAQISSDNISALIDAQSQASANFTRALDSSSLTSDSSSSTPDSSADQPNSAFDAASSTYSAINQLVQSTAVPLGFNPFSVSI
jgi:hypothetical protein